MAITSKQRFKLKKFVNELRQYRGRHTELVSVYIPSGYELTKIIGHLNQEQGTAVNIKSASTRKNVIDALEKMIHHLRLYPKTPPHGLAVFSGNIAEKEGVSDVRVWSIEPAVPLKIRIYRCDKSFVLEPLQDMAMIEDVYGMVVLDRRDAMLALLKGKTIIPLVKTHSEVPGKTRAGGQCLLPESIIQLSDGSLPKIENVHNPNKAKSMIMNNYSIRNSNILDKWNINKNQIYKIITKNPRIEIQSSKNHVFFVSDGKGIIEKSAEELKKGDFLVMPEKINVKGKAQKIDSKQYYNSFAINKEGRKILIRKRLAKRLFQRGLAKKIDVTQTAISFIEIGKRNINRTLLKKLCKFLEIDFNEFLHKYTKPYKYRDIVLPVKLDSDFAQFLGYFIGDGSIEKDRITFFEQSEELALYYKNKFNKYFRTKSSYKFRDSKNYHQIKLTSRPLVRLIKEQFPEIKKSRNTLIPSLILKSEGKVVASFLRGLFDAEGYVSGSKVGLSINNKLMIQQLQMMLLRFGILASVLEYDNRANPYSKEKRFTIEISEKKSLGIFRYSIGFSSEEKSVKLKNVIRNKSDTSYVRQIIVPGTEIRKIIEGAGYNLELFPKVSSFFINKRMMSKQAFKSSILACIKDKNLYKKLKEICDLPILPVKINKIEIINKKTDMVDISVKGKSFIANGLIVHNSAARYERLREGSLKDHFKKIANYMKEQFLFLKNLKGIIIGGPGVTVNDFLRKGYVTADVRQKIIATKDIAYTGEFGLQELLDKSQDVLAAEAVAEEKKLMQRFFELLSTKPKMVAYGMDDVKRALEIGAVETLLLSEDLADKTIEELEAKAEELGSESKIISTETREGVQLRDMGKIAAILRYELES